MRRGYRIVALMLVCVILLAGCKNTAGEPEQTTVVQTPVSETTAFHPQADAPTEELSSASEISSETESAFATEPVSDPATTAIGPETTAAPQASTTVPASSGPPTSQAQAPQTTEPPTKASDSAGTVTTNGGTVLRLSDLRHYSASENAPVVYFTRDISADALERIYGALPYALSGRIAVKLSTGESSATNYLRPELIGGLVQSLNASIVECMTAYGGVRAVAAFHKQVAADRGYTAIAPFDLMDEAGDYEVPYAGTRIDRAIVGDHILNYDGILVLSHFKGHPMGGFGGAIKNVGIGMSSRKGKIYVHSAGTRTTGIVLHSDQKAWLEALAEAVKAVSDFEDGGKKMLYISVMNRLSVDCDCMALPAEPDMHDIGILASADPVALDQACVDLVYAAPDGRSLIQRMESLYGEHTLEHADAIGLGSRAYRLVSIDAP